MALPKGIQKLLAGANVTITAPVGPTSTIAATGGGSTPLPTFHGVGSPEGAQTATAVGQTYLNTASGGQYVFQGTPPSNTGWVPTIYVTTNSDIALADSATPQPMNGSTTSVHLITATPPAWLDTSGNIIEPGFYQSGFELLVITPPTTTGQYVWVSGVIGDLIIPIDPLASFTNVFWLLDTFWLGPSDLPTLPVFECHFANTDVTGVLGLLPYIYRLAQPLV
jgi:hypothetical protein